MRFDKDEQAFVLEGYDWMALQLPQEIRAWPLAEVEDLFEQAAFADSFIGDIDSSYFPGGANRARIIAEQNRRREALRHIRQVIANHALQDGDFDNLLGE